MPKGICPKCGRPTPLGLSGLCTTCDNQQREEMKLVKMQQQEIRAQRGSSNIGSSMHWLYFLLVGWWLGLILCCTILLLLFPGGRSLIKKAFGVW